VVKITARAHANTSVIGACKNLGVQGPGGGIDIRAITVHTALLHDRGGAALLQQAAVAMRTSAEDTH